MTERRRDLIEAGHILFRAREEGSFSEPRKRRARIRGAKKGKDQRGREEERWRRQEGTTRGVRTTGGAVRSRRAPPARLS